MPFLWLGRRGVSLFDHLCEARSPFFVSLSFSLSLFLSFSLSLFRSLLSSVSFDAISHSNNLSRPLASFPPPPSSKPMTRDPRRRHAQLDVAMPQMQFQISS
jgi:hypothetical protein